MCVCTVEIDCIDFGRDHNYFWSAGDAPVMAGGIRSRSRLCLNQLEIYSLTPWLPVVLYH